MRIDKQTITYWSLNEKEHALVIDVLQTISRASVDQLEGLLGENRRTASKYRRDVAALLRESGEDAPDDRDLVKDESEVGELSQEEIDEINAKANSQDYGPFVKVQK